MVQGFKKSAPSKISTDFKVRQNNHNFEKEIGEWSN
jgi:hypothetical protein